jgi:hypothetical protein
MTKKYETGTNSAYRCGWIDGRYGDGELGSFTENLRLAAWETASERLDYYREHRAGRELRHQRSVVFSKPHKADATDA